MSPEDTPGDSTKGAGQAAEAPVKHPIYVVHEQSGGEVDLMDIVDVIVCRWTAIAAVTLLFLLAGYAYIVIALDVYRSEAMLTLTPQQAGGGSRRGRN